MGTLLASAIVARVRLTLVDPNAVGWSDAELYDYLSAAQSAICNAKPDAHTKLEAVDLVAGVVQTLPEDGISLLNVYYNEASGQVATIVGLDLQNAADPRWPLNAQVTDVAEVMVDERTPTRFLVNPPNDGAGRLVVLYGAEPPVLVDGAPSQTISVKDSYQNALWAYTCGLAYAKNTKRQDVTKSNNMMAMFGQMLGLRTAGQRAVAAKLDNVEPT